MDPNAQPQPTNTDREQPQVETPPAPQMQEIPEAQPTPEPQPALEVQQTQQVNDPTQPGYVPPATLAPLPADQTAPEPKKKALSKIIIAVVVGLTVFGGAGIFLKDALFTGSKITKADLVEAQEGTLSFKYPKQWQKSSKTGPDVDAYYIDGDDPELSDQGVAIIIEEIGQEFEGLTEEEQENVYVAVENVYKDPNTLEDENCTEISDMKTERKDLPNYSAAIYVEATCSQIKGRTATAKIKVLIGIKGTAVHGIAIVALSETWEKSGEALDEIITSAKPIESEE